MVGMTLQDRDELRTLQDRFLALPEIIRYIEERGEDARMFWLEHPTANDLKTQLWPQHREGFETTIREYENANSSASYSPNSALRWKKGTIKTTDETGRRALVKGWIAVARNPNLLAWWEVIHVASGLTFGVRFRSQRFAKNAADAILTNLPELNVNSDPSDSWTPEKRRDVRDFVRSLPGRIA